jgi:hypothetical protein
MSGGRFPGVEEVTTEAAARDQLREISRDLDAIRFRLLGVQAILPRSPQEQDPLLESDTMDSSTGLRAAIGCVLQDRIDPALRDLRAADSTELAEREPE